MEIKTFKILAIDDNPDNLVSLKALIKEAFPEATIFTAISGKRGLELSIQEDPDVILLDIVMPEMDGFEVCKKLKADQRLSDIPVVFVTALKGDKESRIKALESGGEAFLAKPVDESELTAQIRAMVKIKAANTYKRNENELLKRLVEERTSELKAELSERKRTEVALTESEEKYRIMVELLPDAVIIHEGGKFVFANATALKTVGADSFEQLIERPLMEYVHPDFRNISMSRIAEIYSTGRPSTFSEEKFITLKNEIIDVEVLGIPILYMGKPAIQTIIRDITERKQAEDLLKESEERFRHISSSISDISFSCETDPSGNSTINWLYGAVEEITGYTSEELIAMKCWGKVVISEDFPIFKSHVLEVLPDYSDECQLRIRKKDGSTVWVQASAECSKGPVGSSYNILYGGLVDITRDKRTEQALQESEAQFREFFEKAADAIFIAEIETGIIVDVNEAATRLMNRSYDQLVGIHQSQLHPPVKENYAKDTFTIHTELVKQKVNSHAIENTVLRADGTEVPVEILASEVDYHGKSCMMGTFRDISKRKKAEELLRESEYFFKESQRAAFVGSYKFDLTNNFWTSSEVLEQIFGIDKSYTKTLQSWLEIIHPDDREMMERYFIEEVIAKRQQFNKEYRIISQIDNELRWVLGLGKLNFDTEGNVIEMIGTIQDITERILAEQARNETYEFNRSLLKTIPFGMDIVDEQGNILFQSENLENVFGKKSMGCKCWNLYRDDKIQCSDCPLHKGIEIGKTDTYESSGVLGGKIFEINHTGMMFKGKKAMLEIFQDITERKIAEEKVKQSYNLLNKLTAQVPGVVYQYRLYPDGRSAFPYSSPGMYDIYEVTPEEVREDASSVFTRIHPEDYDSIVESITESARNQSIYHSEFRVILPKQGLRWRMSDAKPELLEDGSTLWHGIITDITERKLAEERLKESQQLFQELFNASPDAIVLIDPHHPTISWPILDCNEASCKMNGYTRDEMIGQSIDILNIKHGTPEDRNEYIMNLRQKGIIHGEFSHRNKDGHIFPIETSTSLVSIDGREMVLGIDRDITERKKVEKELANQKQRLSDILLGTNAGTWIWNVQTGEVILNDRWAEIIGFNLDELKPININTWISNVHPDDLPAANEMLNKHFNGEFEYFDIEFRQPHKDGKLIWVNARGKVIEWTNDGKPLWMSGTHLDITERKLAEANLQESEDRYRSFISQVSEGVYRFECDEPMDLNLPLEEQVDFIYDHFFIAECNDALLKMYKITDRNEVIGKSHLDFHGGRNNLVNRELLKEFIRKNYSIEAGITEEFDNKGQLRYISNNSVGIIEDNHLVRLWGTETDITEKIRADQVQQVLFSISNAALSSINLPELIEFISKEVGKLLDSTNFFIAFYDEKTDMLSTIYERDEKDVIETWPAQNSITGYVIKNQKPLLLKEEDVNQFYHDSGILPFGTPCMVWLGVPLVTNKKTVGAIVVQSYDNPDAYTEKDKQMLEFISHQISISIERKKTEQDLNLLGKAFDQSPVTIVITDKEGNIEYVNPKFSESTGYTLDEVKGKNPRVIKTGNQSREYYQELWKTILDGKDWVGEFQNKRKNGEMYWESALISPITNEKGEISSFLAIKEDITEKKKMIDDLIHARIKAEESDRLKSSFLANMSHEIRTPLNSIIGFSELLLDEDFGTEQHGEFARTINSSGNSLLTIISDIMDFSKIEAGQIQVSMKRFCVNKLINELQKEYSYKASEKGIELRLDPANPIDEIFIESDEQRIRQVLINFISNAIKFTEKGFVKIGFGRDKACLVSTIQFSVKDTGIGISEEFHQQIFERFRQVESSHTRKYGGNGLGLAISKNLVELLGGQIGMKSEKGKGSVFYFTIPKH